MSELSGIMYVFHEDARRAEAEKDMAEKYVEMTIKARMYKDDFDRGNYECVLVDEDGNSFELTEEQIEALTVEEMARHDENMVRHEKWDLGDLGYDLDSPDLDDVTFEVKED